MLAFLFASGFTENHEQCNAIVGRWISQQGNVIVQIYKDSVTFKGKVLWFNDSDDKNNPITRGLIQTIRISISGTAKF